MLNYNLLLIVGKQINYFLFGRDAITTIGNNKNTVFVSAEKIIESRIDLFLVSPSVWLSPQTLMLRMPVDMLLPFVVHRQTLEEMVEITIIDANAMPGNVGCIDVNQIISSRNIGGIAVQRPILYAIVEHRLVRLSDEKPEPFCERLVPAGLVAECALDFGETDIEVMTMKEVERPFDDASLAKCKEDECKLKRIG